MQEREKNIYDDRKIGVFDSGIGGLTVLKALKRKLPDESYIYIGDTARLPYGTKSRETVIKYSESLTRAVLKQNIKAVVVACNTASTHALEKVKEIASPLPVIGMIEPAAKAACKATAKGHIAVIATTGTIHSGAYTSAIQGYAPETKVSNAACQMLVALAEEGWNEQDDPVARSIIHRYLDPLFDQTNAPDTLILGCTHFPLFTNIISEILGPDVTLINSGEEAAQTVTSQISPSSVTDCHTQFFATDDPVRFARNALRFYDHHIGQDDIELMDIYLYT
ncbi:MAG TPA: glutamate racemase [Alphaproteobacteria bacterium]|nr:glutamate racemase [Alphaproteobacteria bacterium]HNS43662.1 glutamate racemase [Alphaproteobacteria bacterium]